MLYNVECWWLTLLSCSIVLLWLQNGGPMISAKKGKEVSAEIGIRAPPSPHSCKRCSHTSTCTSVSPLERMAVKLHPFVFLLVYQTADDSEDRDLQVD
jgi:hypothetical protein